MHDLNDAPDGHLKSKDAEQATVTHHGCGDEARSSTVARRISGKIDEGDGTGRGAVAGLAIDCGKAAVLPLAGLEICREIALLEDRVDNVAFRGDQKHVVVSARLRNSRNQG